jgi:hypothetical protein
MANEVIINVLYDGEVITQVRVMGAPIPTQAMEAVRQRLKVEVQPSVVKELDLRPQVRGQHE